MALKDKLGLAMIPSAYSGVADENNAGGALGKVHSVFPKQSLSDNLVTNGTFDTDSDWTKGTGWSISGGKAISDGSQSTDSSLYQSNVLTQGELYKFEFTLSNVLSESGSVRLRNGIGSGETYISYKNTNGTYSAYATVVSSNATLVVDADSNFTGSIDNVSVKRIIDGDFDFSRGSDATRVNKDGYIESVQVLSDELVQNGDFEQIGSELVTNGDFSDGSSWDTDTGWTIANGKASQDGTGSGNDGDIIQNLNLDTNKIYKLTLTVTDYTQGTLYVDITNTDLNVTSEGSYTLYFTPTSSFLYIRTRYSNFVGSIDNVSVKEVDPNGYWVLRNGFSIKDGKLHNDGTVINQQSEQKDLFAIGSKYKLSFDLEKLTSGVNMRVRVGTDGANNETIVDKPESGVQSYEFIANGTDLGFLALSDNTGEWTIDNISVVEITDDTDIPRLDYTNQACPSLLLEPQRTNLVTYSNDFTDSSWIKDGGATIDSNASTSPDGTINSSYLKAPSTTNQTVRVYRNFNVTSGNTYTCSVFVKKDNVDFIRLLSTGATASTLQAFYNVSNGTIGSSGSPDKAKIEDYGNGWYRLILIVEATNTGTATFRVQLAKADGNVINNFDGTEKNLIYGAQVEEGSYATSYIPTNGSTVTRLADVCNNAGDSTIFNDEEGVLFVDMKAIADDGNFKQISISDEGNQNHVRIYPSTTANQLVFAVKSGGVNQYVYYHSNFNHVGKFNKIALKYKNNDFSAFINGEKVDSSPSGLTPIGLSKINFDGGSGAAPFYGNVRQLLYFNEALTDAELEALTSSRTSEVLKNYQRRGELLDATYESAHVENKLNELF